MMEMGRKSKTEQDPWESELYLQNTTVQETGLSLARHRKQGSTSGHDCDLERAESSIEGTKQKQVEETGGSYWEEQVGGDLDDGGEGGGEGHNMVRRRWKEGGNNMLGEGGGGVEGESAGEVGGGRKEEVDGGVWGQIRVGQALVGCMG